MLVQFGNNWIQKIPHCQSNLAALRIFLIQLFPNWTACDPITYTYCYFFGRGVGHNYIWKFMVACFNCKMKQVRDLYLSVL